jgi:RNA polymerase sigma-70 factor, ECF subfamily
MEELPAARSHVSTSSFGRAAEDGLLDRETLRGIAAGDGDALARLYDRHARPVFSLALHVLGDRDEAEEVVQDVFAQAWNQIARYDATRGTAVAWLLMMTRSRSIDRLRRRRCAPALVSGSWKNLNDVEDSRRGPEMVALTTEHATLLRAALERLPLIQRWTIELAFFEGLTHVEIAGQLQEPLGTIKTRIRLGLLKLRDAISTTTP